MTILIEMSEATRAKGFGTPESIDQETLRQPTQQTSPLLDLPPELHGLVLQYLPYPDSLSLKITHPYFHDLIQPTHTVAARVTWLLNRAEEGLCIPKSRRLNLKTEQAFLANSEVKTILRNRRLHKECGHVWTETNRQQPKRGSWLYGNATRRSGATPQCLVDPNVRICTGIEGVIAKESGVMTIEKRYSSVKERVAARLSVPSCLLLPIPSHIFLCAATLASGLVLLEYLAQPFGFLTWTEAFWICQSIIICIIARLICGELLFPQPILSNQQIGEVD